MSRRQANHTIRRLAIGSGLAAVAGYLVGVLTAPKSGKRTQKDIKIAADRSRVQAEKDLKKLHLELDKVLKDAKAKGNASSTKAKADAKTLLNKAAVTKEKVREVISAIHQGKADDQDLKRSLKNAQAALDHLKDYLKK